jgi:hypothetical protein
MRGRDAHCAVLAQAAAAATRVLSLALSTCRYRDSSTTTPLAAVVPAKTASHAAVCHLDSGLLGLEWWCCCPLHVCHQPALAGRWRTAVRVAEGWARLTTPTAAHHQLQRVPASAAALEYAPGASSHTRHTNPSSQVQPGAAHHCRVPQLVSQSLCRLAVRGCGASHARHGHHGLALGRGADGATLCQ